MAKKDLVLRDQTLRFVKCISLFIKSLSGAEQTVSRPDSAAADEHLASIFSALHTLIHTIYAVLEANPAGTLRQQQQHRRRLNDQIDELKENLNLLAIELRLNKIERVVNLSLEMAKNANELFLGIASNN